MDDWKVEINSGMILDRCKCCLGDGPLKELWLEYREDGKNEIYGEMLNQCFDLTEYNTEVVNEAEKICESCICRLRDALEFKQEVLACGQLRYECLNNGLVTPKKEPDDYAEEESDMVTYNEPDSGYNKEQNFEDVEYLELEDNDITETNQANAPIKNDNTIPAKMVTWPKVGRTDERLKIIKQEINKKSVKTVKMIRRGPYNTRKVEKDLNVSRKPPNSLDFTIKNIKEERYVEEGECLEDDMLSDNDPDSDYSNEQGFEDVEYLELDDNEVVESNQAHTSRNKVVSAPPRDERKPTKWPRKKKKEEKMKIYKQYIRQDMLKAVETVQQGLLSTREAAKEFNVPRKTLATKLLMAQREKDNTTPELEHKNQKRESHYQFIEEVKKVLTYTNAVPFKTRATRYFCTYCSTDGPCFEEPDELRAHTRTEHVDDKTRNIEMVLRPQYQNEVIKMDIDALHCTVCCTIIPTWTDMFKHLEEVHNIELDQAYTKIIPYILKRDLKCALCSESFPNYHHLDSHMNSHYASYICSECGDTFLSASRLSKHIKVHNTGRFPCEACGKVFARDRYRQKHFDHVHKQEHNIKCLYCPEKFYGTFQRHLHMVEKHKEKVRITTCELCGMKFEWRRYYVAHMRRKHNIRTI